MKFYVFWYEKFYFPVMYLLIMYTFAWNSRVANDWGWQFRGGKDANKRNSSFLRFIGYSFVELLLRDLIWPWLPRTRFIQVINIIKINPRFIDGSQSTYFLRSQKFHVLRIFERSVISASHPSHPKAPTTVKRTPALLSIPLERSFQCEFSWVWFVWVCVTWNRAFKPLCLFHCRKNIEIFGRLPWRHEV